MSSSTESSSGDDDAVSREVAWRVLAREYEDATYGFKEGEDERAPNYVVTPTGAKINRIFAVGVVTEVERVGDEDGLLRARISDPTGVFVVYAGQYQPDAVSFLADVETPSFVAVVGKARTYEPEDSDDVYTSIRPEEMNVVDSETRDRWNVETARETLKRIDAFRSHLRGDDTPELRPSLHDLDDTADYYGTDADYFDELEREARDALSEVVGDEALAEGSTETETGGAETTSVGSEDEVSEVEDDREGASEPETDTGEEAETETGGAQAETETPQSETEAEPSETTEDDDLGDFDDFEDVEQEDVGDWEWDEGQREEIEEEFGAEFETADEVEEPEEDESGSLEEETETEDEEDDSEAEEEESETEEAEEEDDEEAETESEPEEDEETEDESAGDVDSPRDLVMGIIEENDDGDGVERSEIVETAAERGLSDEEAEDTLEDLLLEGMCYPTDGDRIKPL